MYPPNSSRGPTPTIQNLKQGAKDFCPCCTYTQNIVRQMVGNHYFFYWTTSGGWFTERGKLRIEARLFVFKCNKSDIKRFQKVRPHFSIVMVIYDKKISNDWWICTLLILDNQKYNIDAKNIESMCNKKDDLRIWSSKKA